jgi:hypothetical protein
MSHCEHAVETSAHKTIRKLLLDLEQSRQVQDVMRETLTRCQEQCTALVLENRRLHELVTQQLDISMKSLQTQADLLSTIERQRSVE